MPQHLWHSAVGFEVLQDEEFAKRYWYRSGVLLALLGAFNFTDGRFENLIASESGPVVVDAETLFHNFRCTLGPDEERSVLCTGLFQRRFTETGLLGPVEAFQMAGGARRSEMTAPALNERSDTLRVSFTRYFNESGLNYPILKGRCAYLGDYLREFESGLRYGYFSLAGKSREFLVSELWGRIKQLKVRQLIRQAKYYTILVCRSRISQVLGRPEEVKQLVRDSLMENGDSIIPDVDFLPDPFLDSVDVSPLVAYESECILRGDVPIFYSSVGGTDLWAGDGDRQPGFFPISAATEVEENFTRLGDGCAGQQIAIVRFHLDLDGAPIGAAGQDGLNAIKSLESKEYDC